MCSIESVRARIREGKLIEFYWVLLVLGPWVGGGVLLAGARLTLTHFDPYITDAIRWRGWGGGVFLQSQRR